MPISGLVITLSDEPGARSAALAAIARERRVEIGLPTGNRVPLVLETRGEEEDRALWDWLRALDGVMFIDVACIHFDEEARA